MTSRVWEKMKRRGDEIDRINREHLARLTDEEAVEELFALLSAPLFDDSEYAVQPLPVSLAKLIQSTGGQ